MSLQELGSLGEFISSIAVVLSLIYVAFQLRQNTNQQRRNEANIGQDQFSEFRLLLMQDADFARIWDAGQNEPDSLDRIELMRFEVGVNQISWTIFYIWDRRNAGMIDEGDWERMESFIRELYDSAGASRWWNEYKGLFSEEYQSEISRIVARRKQTDA
jgi:hypothetical protein